MVIDRRQSLHGFLGVTLAALGSGGALTPVFFAQGAAKTAPSGAQIPIEDFLPRGYDYRKDDASGAFAAAANASVRKGATITANGRYRFARNLTISQEGARFWFDGARFDLLDIDRGPVVGNGSSGPIGILVKAAYVLLGGTAGFYGQGVPGTTRLAGLVCDHAHHCVTGDFHFENMAAGLMALHSDHAQFGHITAKGMRGRQTFGKGSAGSALVAAGNRFSIFGNVHSEGNYKPVVYASVSEDREKRRIDNEDCHFGMVSGTSWPNSPESSLISVRSAKRCSFAGGSGTGFAYGLYLVRYASDRGWSVDQNEFGHFTASINNSTSSVDAGLASSAQDRLEIGRNRIVSLSVAAEDPNGGSEFGALIDSGQITIDRLHCVGFTFGLQFYNCRIEIGDAIFERSAAGAIRYGQGISGAIRNTRVITGPILAGRTSTIVHANSLGSGGISSFEFGHIEFDRNGVGNDVSYVFSDRNNGPEAVVVHSISGSGRRGQARWSNMELPAR